ncbi:CinA family protein [Erythrobacter sp. SD-21]|uniref:CinA family protein n=1 Tax=Erythrobacter sp. SD-21 TaxID=161528 RepID=UPI000153FBE5|nr:CinA family protein [Erythrobacter sp. SD-21]EDL50001.1 hypothetical protein ED21_26058 [Erythrobacter sp. SD-21]
MTNTIQPILPDKVSSLAHEVLQLADEQELRLATAESCTGGLLAAILTDISGLSHVFERGFITYSDQAKCDMLDCNRKEIEHCGAVSREVAIAMAQGALKKSEADLVISITGFAGPAGTDDEEGLVHFGIGRSGAPPDHEEHHFGSLGRDGVRVAALEVALSMMKNALLK